MAALSTPGVVEATSCIPECECPLYSPGDGGRDYVIFPGDGGTAATDARLFVARPELDVGAITLVETATDAPVAFRIEPTAWSASHVWIVPEERLLEGTQYTLRVGDGAADVSTFVAEGGAGLPPGVVQTSSASHVVPCNEAVYVALDASTHGNSTEQLFHFTVEGGGLPAPIHVYRSGGSYARLLLGRALDDEGCFEDTLPEAEDGAEYDVHLEVYDRAGRRGTETATVRVTTAHKETSPPGDATCQAGCCVLSVGAGSHSDAGGPLVALAMLIAWRWRRRSRSERLAARAAEQ